MSLKVDSWEAPLTTSLYVFVYFQCLSVEYYKFLKTKHKQTSGNGNPQKSISFLFFVIFRFLAATTIFSVI
jgi:hypothetical protein